MKPILHLLTPANVARFWSSVALPEDQAACFHWIGDCHARGGYGRVRLKGGIGSYRSPRVALVLKLGRDLAPGMQATHLCDCRRCVNPNHIVEAPPSINKLHEMIARRHAHGERVGSARLTGAHVLEIVSLIREGVPREAIASRYGVGLDTIGDIQRGRTWRHVTGLARTRTLPPKLTPDEQRAIALAHFRDGERMTDISRRLGISKKLVRSVLVGDMLPGEARA